MYQNKNRPAASLVRGLLGVGAITSVPVRQSLVFRLLTLGMVSLEGRVVEHAVDALEGALLGFRVDFDDALRAGVFEDVQYIFQ